MNRAFKVVVIGGSAGSFNIVNAILANLKKDFSFALVLCLHRLKTVKTGLAETLSLNAVKPVLEPEDKDTIMGGKIYLAASNYHLFAEMGNTFALSTEEMYMFSRPSIDLTFETFSYVYRDKMLGIILSGANTDGCIGLKKCKIRGGYTIVQDPEEAQVKTMVNGALKLKQPDSILKTNEIIEFLNNLK